MPTDTPIHVLHVDDEPGFADMVAEFLEREDPQLHVQTATTVEDGLDRLEEADFDCIVSDYDMSGRNGLQFLSAVRDTNPDLPFILFTGKGGEEIASDAISAGVTDYLQKEGGSSQYTLLAHRITNAVAQYQSQREIETSQERLSLFFEHSPLGAIEWNDDFEIARINNTGREILGYGEDELIGSSWRQLVPESKQDAVAETLSKTATGSTVYDIEHETVTKDGERIIVEWHHRTIRDELGDVVLLFSKFQDVTSRVERQQQLAEERAFTEQALDTLDNLFYVVDAEGNLQRWNERLAVEAGYSDDELAGLNALELFPEDEQSKVSDAIGTAIDAGSTTVEADVLTASRGRVPYELTGQRLANPDGGFLGLVGTGRDLSEQKEREHKLAFARELLEKTEQIADVGGWQIDTATNEVYWSDHLFEMLGIDGDEAPPLDEALDVYVPEDRPVVEQAIEDAVAAGESFDVEARFERADGEIRWFRILGEPTIESGEVVQLRGAVQDITDHKRREHNLQQARAEYEELFNGMNDAGWVLDLDGEILAVNDAAVTRTGYTRDELVGMCPHEITAGHDDEEITAMIEGMPVDETQVLETIRVTKSGEHIPIEISSSLITYRGETAVLSISRDISERKQREQQLETFASVVSHDLRNPLNVADGYLELAREERESEHLDRVAQAHDRMNNLIEELLTLAQDGDEIGEMDVVELGGVVENAWGNVATADATLTTEIDGVVRADGSRLKQLVENLLRNAVEHGGTDVSVTVGSLSDGFYVEDDGSGIPEVDREDVFEMGYSTREGGAGFGLSIAKQVADAHGWDISVTTGSEGGARFEITGVDAAAE